VAKVEEATDTASRIESLKPGVRKSLPELEWITDVELREKVVAAWALALSETEFQTIDDIPGSGGPNDWFLREGTQAHHVRGVARIAAAILEQVEEVFGPTGANRDTVLAAGVLHDVGKAFEFSPRNQERWKKNPAASGYPAVRHPSYGLHIALTVGLPESIVNTVGYHSLPSEGQFVLAGVETMLVQYADNSVWRILERAGLVYRTNQQ
jgi:putative nucleotidyltransferase with HDIG domain